MQSIPIHTVLAAQFSTAVVYASDRSADRNKVFHYHPFHNTRECIGDLSETRNETVYAESVCISTGAEHWEYYCGSYMFGGFDGEYALRNMLHGAEDRLVVVGYVTRAPYGIESNIVF